MAKKRVVILGSTGSIGKNGLQVLSRLRDRFEVVGLAAGSRWELLAEQASDLRPEVLAISDAAAGDALRSAIGGRARVLSGPDALEQLVETTEFDCVIVGVVGTSALSATLRAVALGKRIAIASKELLVVAGPLMAEMARESGAELLPVDSEHSAVFQALHAGKAEDVQRVVLTASGGPFWTWPPERIATATVRDALKHPTWDMGPKITIDSATMMNKALEIVEARWLFGLCHDQIEVVVHPESIVHSFVEFRDGSLIAQLGTPDMRTPIQYALTYPDRLPCPSPRLDLTRIRSLNFYSPDEDRFPALRLGHRVAEQGGTAGAVLNAANESAVALFREGSISFLEITATVEQVLKRHEWQAAPTFDDLMRADAWARDEVLRCTVC